VTLALGPLVLGGVRGLHMAAYLAAFGSLLFGAVFAPVPRRLAWGFALVALVAGAAWFLLQTADFASPQSWGDEVAAFPIVAAQTRFGLLLLARLGLLALAMGGFARGWTRLAAIVAGAGVLAEAWLGHGAAMGGVEGDALFAASVVHLAAAGAWLGTLPALWVALGRSPDVALLRRYSLMGRSCMAVLLATAALYSVLLIGSVGAAFTTAYGLVALGKFLLLAALILLVFRAPRLRRATPRRVVAAEIALGLAVLLAAGVLLELEPPAMAGMVSPE